MSTQVSKRSFTAWAHTRVPQVVNRSRLVGVHYYYQPGEHLSGGRCLRRNGETVLIPRLFLVSSYGTGTIHRHTSTLVYKSNTHPLFVLFPPSCCTHHTTTQQPGNFAKLQTISYTHTSSTKKTKKKDLRKIPSIHTTNSQPQSYPNQHAVLPLPYLPRRPRRHRGQRRVHGALQHQRVRRVQRPVPQRGALRAVPDL